MHTSSPSATRRAHSGTQQNDGSPLFHSKRFSNPPVWGSPDSQHMNRGRHPMTNLTSVQKRNHFNQSPIGTDGCNQPPRTIVNFSSQLHDSFADVTSPPLAPLAHSHSPAICNRKEVIPPSWDSENILNAQEEEASQRELSYTPNPLNLLLSQQSRQTKNGGDNHDDSAPRKLPCRPPSNSNKRSHSNRSPFAKGNFNAHRNDDNNQIPFTSPKVLTSPFRKQSKHRTSAKNGDDKMIRKLHAEFGVLLQLHNNSNHHGPVESFAQNMEKVTETLYSCSREVRNAQNVKEDDAMNLDDNIDDEDLAKHGFTVDLPPSTSLLALRTATIVTLLLYRTWKDDKSSKENMERALSVATSSIRFLKAVIVNLQPELVFALLRFPVSVSSLGENAGGKDTTLAVLDVLTQIVIHGEKDRSAEDASKMSPRKQWFNNEVKRNAFVALSHGIQTAEIAHKSVKASFSMESSFSSGVDSSAVGTWLEMGLERDSVNILARCTTRYLLMGGKELDMNEDLLLAGTSILANLFRLNLVSGSIFDGDFEDHHSDSATLCRSLVGRIHAFFYASNSTSIHVFLLSVSSLSLLSLLIRHSYCSRESLEEDEGHAIYASPCIDYLLTICFMRRINSVDNMKNKQQTNYVISKASQMRAMLALSDMCERGGVCGALSKVESSKHFIPFLKKGWTRVINHVNSTTDGKKVSSNNDEVGAMVMFLLSLHGYTSMVRRCLLTVLAPRKENSSNCGGSISSDSLGSSSISSITNSTMSASCVLTLENLLQSLLMLSYHENVLTASLSSSLLRCILHDSPSNLLNDEVSRQVWKQMENASSEISEELLCMAASTMQYYSKHRRVALSSSSSSTSKGHHRALFSDGNPRDDSNKETNNDDLILATMWCEPRLSSCIDLLNVIFQSESCIKAFFESSEVGGLITSFSQVATSQISRLEVMRQKTRNKEGIISSPKKRLEFTNDSLVSNYSFLSGAGGTLACSIVLSTTSLLVKLVYSNIPCVDKNRRPLVDLTNDEQSNISLISEASENKSIQLIQKTQQGARKLLRGCLINQSKSKNCNMGDEKNSSHSPCWNIETALMYGSTQGLSQDLTCRAMRLNRVLQATTRENEVFCINALFTGCFLSGENNEALRMQVKNQQMEMETLTQLAKKLSKECDQLKSIHARKTMSWERELNYAKLQVESKTSEIVDRYARESDASERQVQSLQHSLIQMKHKLVNSEKKKEENQAALERASNATAEARAERDHWVNEEKKMRSVLEQEEEKHKFKDVELKKTVAEASSLRESIESITNVRDQAETNLSSCKKEVISLRLNMEHSESRVDDAYGKLTDLAEAFKAKELRLSALQKELEESTRSSTNKLKAAMNRCASAETRSSELEKENEALKEKCSKLKRTFRRETEKGKPAVAAYRTQRKGQP